MYRRVARFNRAGRKTSALPPYITFNCHLDENHSPGLAVKEIGDDDVFSVSVCAIDPAIKNCAVRIEKRYYKLKDSTKLPTISNLDLSTPLRKIETVLQVKFDFTTGIMEDASKPVEKKKRVYRKKKDATATDDTSAVPPAPVAEEPVDKNNMAHYVNFISNFDDLAHQFKKCHYILMESQMPINTEMVRMSQAIITYLMIKTQNASPINPLIVEVDPKIKSSIFKAPPMKKPALKKWAANKALEILDENEDVATATFLRSVTKRDDHGDVICYTTGWFKMLAVGGFFPPPV